MAGQKHFCASCGKKMVYDKTLSRVHRHSVWWCLPCELIEYYEEHNVHSAVTSVKRYVFYGKLS